MKRLYRIVTLCRAVILYRPVTLRRTVVPYRVMPFQSRGQRSAGILRVNRLPGPAAKRMNIQDSTTGFIMSVP